MPTRKATFEQDHDPCCLVCGFIYSPRTQKEEAGAMCCANGSHDDGVHEDNFICSVCAEATVACPKCKSHLEFYISRRQYAEKEKEG